MLMAHCWSVPGLLILLGFLATCAPPAAPASNKPAVAAPPTTATAPASAPTVPQAQPAALLPPPTQRITVKMGGLGGAIDRALFVGQEKGYYDEQGIDLEVETYRSAADMVPLLATGKLDIGHGSTNPGFFNAILSGIPVKVVSDVTLLREPSQGYINSLWVVMSKDLADQVQGMADLKGRTVAINNRGTMNHGQLEKILADHGLRLDDVQIESIPFPDMMTALANNAVDAAVVVEPFVTLAQMRNIAVPLYDMGRGFPGYPVQYLFYGPEFVREQPDTARRFMVAYMKALRYLEDAFHRGINREEAVQYFIKHTPVKDAPLYDRMGPSYNETNGNVNVRAIEADQDFYVRQGFQRSKIDVRSIVDTSFAEFAVQVLGRYQ
jgi:ABC-type nitrate/sulfonate/bicarbonate transport system substrate-binding protein